MPDPRRSIAALLPILLLAAIVVAAEDDAAPTAPLMPVDLTGVWNLDAMASDDLAEVLQPLAAALEERAEQSRPAQGYGDEEGMTPANRPPRRGSGAGGEAADPAIAREVARAMDQLLIIVNGADLEIMDGSDRTRVWTPGGRPVQRPGFGGQVLEQAWWDGDELVLSTTGGPVIVTRRLHLEDDGSTLVVDLSAQLSRSVERAQARLVYTGY
jgi:hypothetical protein